MIGPGNVHRCSGDPIEAGSYCLQAEGPMIERFRANGKAELKVDVEEESSEDQQKPEHSVVELPVDFSKYDLAKVSWKTTFWKRIHDNASNKLVLDFYDLNSPTLWIYATLFHVYLLNVFLFFASAARVRIRAPEFEKKVWFFMSHFLNRNQRIFMSETLFSLQYSLFFYFAIFLFVHCVFVRRVV